MTLDLLRTLLILATLIPFIFFISATVLGFLKKAKPVLVRIDDRNKSTR